MVQEHHSDIPSVWADPRIDLPEGRPRPETLEFIVRKFKIYKDVKNRQASSYSNVAPLTLISDDS